MNILSVDDNPNNLYLIEMIARAHGHDVVSAHNGLEALEQLAGRTFDLIVSDILMPGMDGFQLCRTVKSDARLKHIPFVFYTATYTAKQDEKLGLSLGASRFIIKPVEPDEFLTAVEEVVREGAAGSLPVQPTDPDDAYENLSLYNERLVRKLEHKIASLESTRIELSATIEEKNCEILQRRRAEEAHARSEEQLRLSWDASMDGMLLTDREGVILRANPAFARIFLKPPEALTGQVFATCYGEGADSILETYRKQVGSRAVEAHFEAPRRRWDGKEIWVESSNALVDLPSGLAVVSVLRDITDRKRAERERAELEDQLRQAQKLESVGRLAGGIAHDFNNLLTVINGYSVMIAGQLSPGDPLLAAVDEIHRAGQRASDLTRRLLGFSRKRSLQAQVLDLNRIVEETRPLLNRLVGEDVVLRVLRSAEPAVVRADPGQLEQVLMNLAVNSRDAMPRGGELSIEIRIVERGAKEVEAYASAHPGPYAALTVVDNGEGMSAETCQRIFEPFFTTKEAGKGTGLGLSMVQSIVSQSGGFITVRSAPGQGTTFGIYLPALAATPALPEAPAAAKPLHGSETILVVEDQPQVRKYVMAALRSYGYRLLQAGGAAEAQRVCEAELGRVDLLLTDVVMPHTSGKELADRVRERWPGVRVLFMSGYADNATTRLCLTAEKVNFLQKPFSPEQLAAKVREVLSSPAPAAGTTQP
jgi:PAS domain S-box-containing protein